jgi:hypothetical protein
MARLPRLFISYSKQDAEFVRYLAALLKAQGFSIWYDSELNPGDDWWTVLEQEIYACDAFIVVMTQAGRTSRWVQRELLLAEKLNKLIFPVLLSGDEWANLADVQFVDMRAGLRAPLSARFLEQLRTLDQDIAPQSIQLVFENADIMTYPADVAAFKYAQGFHAADGHAAALLRNAGIDESEYTPYPGEYSLIATQDALTAGKVLFIGTERLKLIGYDGYQRMAVETLKALKNDAPETKHLVMTFHGGGHGLDENEAAISQLRGLIAAVAEDQYPPALERITIVERAENRFRRLNNSLTDLLNSEGLSRTADGWHIPLKTDAAAPEPDIPVQQTSSRTHAFVVMPQDPALDDLFYYAIQTPVHAYGLLCERLEVEEYDADVIKYLEDRLATATIVVAIVPAADPLLYWQIGYARGARCPVVLVGHKSEDQQSPVLQGLPQLTYTKLRDVETGLAEHLQQLQQRGKL